MYTHIPFLSADLFKGKARQEENMPDVILNIKSNVVHGVIKRHTMKACRGM
jgi:hypothetical protein